jgi:hypothetical protein
MSEGYFLGVKKDIVKLSLGLVFNTFLLDYFTLANKAYIK